MTKTHRVPLRYTKCIRPPVVLTYNQMRLDRSQARLVGREALVPKIALEDYSCNAVIDWIMIDVQLSRLTQHQWLADAFAGFGRRPYMKAVDPGDGNESRRFTIKIQEPDLRELGRIVAAIDRKYGLTSEPLVVGMEVSVDFYPKKPSDEARARMLGVLSRHLGPDTDIFDTAADMPRLSWGTKHRWLRLQESRTSPRDPYRFAVVDTLNSPGADTTTYFGAETSDAMIRVMDKVLDGQNTFTRTQEVLAPEKQRCRVEVTLRRTKLEALGIRHLHDVVCFKFATLQGLYFQFKLATVPAQTMEPVAAYRERARLQMFFATGISGLAKMDQTISTHSAALRPQVRRDLAQRGKPLAGPPRTASGSYGTAVAYKQLCKKVQTALANLSRTLTTQVSDEEL